MISEMGYDFNPRDAFASEELDDMALFSFLYFILFAE
jgi:hypothetical protein